MCDDSTVLAQHDRCRFLIAYTSSLLCYPVCTCGNHVWSVRTKRFCRLDFLYSKHWRITLVQRSHLHIHWIGTLLGHPYGTTEALSFPTEEICHKPHSPVPTTDWLICSALQQLQNCILLFCVPSAAKQHNIHFRCYRPSFWKGWGYFRSNKCGQESHFS